MSAVTHNRDRKFDVQLSEALINERRLADVFAGARLERIELKSETWLWKRSGNICIEYRHNGRPSGIATTDADVWVHELKRDGETLGWVMFPIEHLKALCPAAIKRGARRGRRRRRRVRRGSPPAQGHPSMSGEFSVCQFFDNGSHEYVRRFVGPREAVEAAHHYTHNVATMLGMVERVIITDGDDYCCFEWRRGEGVTFPPEMRGRQ